MQKVLNLIRSNAKAIVAAVATVVAGVGFDVPVEAQAAIVTILVWLIPNTGSRD